jgi:cysteine-rich repeat protein
MRGTSPFFRLFFVCALVCVAFSPIAVHAACGDGAVDGTDACDDGNLVPGDGCDAACVVEPGFVCAPDGSLLSHCRPEDTIYVSASAGSDATGSGAATLRYQTVSKALASLSVPDTTVVLAAGGYGAGPAALPPTRGVRVVGEVAPSGGVWAVTVSGLAFGAGADAGLVHLENIHLTGALVFDTLEALRAERVRFDGGGPVVTTDAWAVTAGAPSLYALVDCEVRGPGVGVLVPAASTAPPCSVQVHVEGTMFEGIAGTALRALDVLSVRIEDSTVRDCATMAGTGAALHVSVGLTCGGAGSALRVSRNTVSLPSALLSAPCVPGTNVASVWVAGAASIIDDFSVDNTTASGHCVGVRASEVSDAALMPFGYVPVSSDVRKFVRELARADNNNALGVWHDVVRGPPAHDALVGTNNFCDALCPAPAFANGTAAPAIVHADFRTRMDVHKPGAGHAGDFLLGQDSCATTGASADAAELDARLATASGFTVELWFRHEQSAPPAAPDGRVLVSSGSSLRVWSDSTHVRARVVIGATPIVLAATATTVLGDWYHLAVTFDGTNARLHLDGLVRDLMPVAGTLAPHSGPVPAAPVFEVGCAAWGLGGFVGRIDEVRAWSRARTATQVVAASTASVQSDALGLEAYYPFDRLGWEPVSQPPYAETV